MSDITQIKSIEERKEKERKDSKKRKAEMVRESYLAYISAGFDEEQATSLAYWDNEDI